MALVQPNIIIIINRLCRYVYVCLCRSMYVYICLCMSMYVYVCLCICMCMYVCVCMFFVVALKVKKAHPEQNRGLPKKNV